MKKDLDLTTLFELYKGLLTEKQREIFSSYYYFDLSLAEIAEFSGATRQSVHLALKSVKDKLNELESLLKLNSKFKKVENLLESENDLKEKVMAILGE